MKNLNDCAAAGSVKNAPVSILSLCVLWGGLFLLIQQVERFFLLPTTLALESPTLPLMMQTLIAGISQDLAVTAGALAVGAVLALPIGLVALVFSRRPPIATKSPMSATCLRAGFGLVALTLAIIMMVDMSYYHWNHQRMNFVFFEYVADFLSAPVGGTQESQAVQQTAAEFQNMGTWGVRACAFLLVESMGIVAWWRIHRWIAQKQARSTARTSFALNSVLALLIVIGTLGASPYNTPIKPTIESDAYYMLAQNPILFSKDSARAALFHHWEWVSQLPDRALSVDDAVEFYQSSRVDSAVFPYQRYPFVGQAPSHERRPFQKPPNVLVIFVEGLDRRYLGQTVHADPPIRVTPFLDTLKQDSLYFENFYSNGVQTSRGLFATLCSYYPRQGAAAMKARSTRGYLCLPSLLHEQGYRTEMVVGQHGSINNLRNFFTRNGIEYLYDRDDFPPHAEHMGLGMTDAAIFDLITARLRATRNSEQPLFLTALTLSMHHPFLFPMGHPEVKGLDEAGNDRYVPALRYFDSEFERFFMRAQRESLLNNTIVLVLGDHGRHEEIGGTDVEKQVGHFLTPLFIWLDVSLRTDETYYPRIAGTIASQVDVAPTILALSHSEPTRSPFVGRSLSCLLAGDCLRDNTAYLTSVYDDLIGLAGEKGIWLYSFRKKRLDWTDLALQVVRYNADERVDASSPTRQLFSLYLASNMLLEQDRIWSWSDLKEALYYGRENPPSSANTPLPPS